MEYKLLKFCIFGQVMLKPNLGAKISDERCNHESVDEKSLSYAMSRKTTKERIQAVMG